MKTQKELKMSIMGRVYIAYAMRRVFRSSTIRALLSVGSLAGILSFVSVLNVLKNVRGITDAGAFYNFGVDAITNTELSVQISLLVFFVVLVWYAKDVVAGLYSTRSQAV